MACDSPINFDDEEEDSDVCGNGKDKMLPTVIIYDERFTRSHTRRFSVSSGVFDGTDGDVDDETEADTSAAYVTAAVNKTDVNALERRSSKSSTAQWSYLHLPGV